MSVEEPSPELIAHCVEVVAEALVIGDVEPLHVPLPAPTVDSKWLDTIEHEVFADAVGDAPDAGHLRCEWGGFRLVRWLADDDAVAVRALCERTACGPKPLNSRLAQLMKALRRHAPVLPAHSSRSLH